MAQFSVNAQRFDPYKNFKFRVKWDGTICRRHQQSRRPETHHRSGGASRRRRSEHQPQIAGAHANTKRLRWSAASPTTRNSSRWANKVWNFGSGLGAEVSLKDFRKDIIIELSTTRRASWRSPTRSIAAGCRNFRHCPTSMPMPTPSPSSTIKLENEGWEQDV